MKNITLAFLAIWASFALNLANAQTMAGKITGQVLDAEHQPAVASTVILVNAKDSAIVKTALADAQGRFLLEPTHSGDFRIWVTMMGFQKYRSEVIHLTTNTPAFALPAITLQQAGTALKAVAITAQKQFVEQKIDRMVVNVGASIGNTGLNALEVLEKTPGVLVDQSGKISFKGKSGVMVMIDDKPTYLSGDNLANYLRSLPASQLDQIELMTTPPAKYDASGNAGVINIKTKKSKAMGFNGSVAVNAGKAMFWRTNESLTLNYHAGKVNLFANAGYNLYNNYRRLDVGRYYLDNAGNQTSSYNEVAFFYPLNQNPNLKLGMDYYISPKTTIGFVLTGSAMVGNISNDVYSTLKNGAGHVDSTIVADNNTHNHFMNGGINLNYSHQFDSLGKSITFDLDYLTYSNERTQSFLNNAYNSAGSFSATQLITNKLPTDIGIYSAKADFTLPLKNKAKFAAGLKTGSVNTDNAANYYNVVGSTSTVDNNNSNHFLYHENINAAYVNLNQELKRFAFQAGLRTENTNLAGHQLGNARSPDSSFVQHYTSLFPTAYVLYKLDTAGHHTLNLSYGRRIDRPYYQDLNPFVTILDKYSQFVGNPYLKPQYASVYTLTYGYRGKLNIAAEYTDIADYQVEYDYQKGNIFVANTINLGHRIHRGISASLNLDPAKWWSFYLYTELDNNTFRGQLSNNFLNTTTTYVFINGNSQFKLGKTWSAELSYFYMSPATDAQFTHIARYQINAGLQKKIWNNKAAIKLTARDIFNSNLSAGNITNVPNVRATYHNDFANRVVILGFTYAFGTAAKNQKKHDSGADSEAGRVR